MFNFLRNYLFIFLFFSSIFNSFIPIAYADLKAPCSTPGKDGGCDAILTGFGSVGTHFTDTVSSLFIILLGFAGAVAVLLIIFAGYTMMMSEGNAEKVKGARETLTAAIVGLLFILFSGAILQIIGVDILKLPGFSK